MKRLGLLSSLVVMMILFPATRAFAQCGVERWSVKTGTDADVGLINLNSSKSTSIQSLSALATPSSIPDNRRLQPTETTIWVLNATLKKFVRAYDSDYHMVLMDSAGRTMIAEIPAPGCVGPGSPFAAGIAHARAQFDAVFTATSSFQSTDVPVQVTGVGFFDYVEGQEGIAPNGVELHPIIDINFNPYFLINSSTPSLTIVQGVSGTSSITSTLAGNFNSAVALSVSGLPAGATASFSPTTIAAPGSGSSNLTISVGAATSVGTYNLIVTGTGGGQTHSTTVNLTVNPGGGSIQQLMGNPGFENGSANPTPWTVSAGVVDNSSFQASHTGSWKAWLNGYGSAHTDSILQTVSIPATATGATLSFWIHIDTAETTTTLANDTLKVQIRNSAGTVLTTLATYSNLNLNTGYRQVSFDVSAYKGQTVQVYLLGVENSKLKTSFVVDDFTLNATSSGGGNFAISAQPSALAIMQSGAGASTISSSVAGSFNSAVTLSVSGLPSGITASFSPATIGAPGTGSSTLTISVDAFTSAGTYNATVTGSGGGQTHSTIVTVTVNSSGGGSTQQLLGNPGFENGAAATAPWTVSSGVVDNSSFQLPHSGSWKAWLNGYGSAHTDTLFQPVSIPSAASNATLSFWLHIDTAETTTTTAFDTLQVQIRNSSGTILAVLATYSNLNAATDYKQVSYDVSAYKGQAIQVYLVGTEDSSLKTSFVVDDFVLNVTTP